MVEAIGRPSPRTIATVKSHVRSFLIIFDTDTHSNQHDPTIQSMTKSRPETTRRLHHILVTLDDLRLLPFHPYLIETVAMVFLRYEDEQDASKGFNPNTSQSTILQRENSEMAAAGSVQAYALELFWNSSEFQIVDQ